MRTLVEVEQEQVVSFSFILTPLAGADTRLGSGGEEGASDGMITVATSRVEVALCRPQNDPLGAREMR